MSGGGKGGSETTQVQIPPWLVEPSKRAIQRGEDIAEIGYVPYMGPDVAALSPMQMSAMNNTNSAASAFGMDATANPLAGLPEAQNYGGVMGYSGYPIFEQAKAAHAEAFPNQAAYMADFFIDPVGGGQQAAPSPGGKGGGSPFGHWISGGEFPWSPGANIYRMGSWDR